MADGKSLSILTSIKKLLGLEEEYEQFDIDIIMHINTAFMILNQLSLGPSKGFSIDDKESKWNDFIGDRNDLNSIKTYVYYSVKLAFDPPQPAYLYEGIKKQKEELEWRLRTQMETPSYDGEEDKHADNN